MEEFGDRDADYGGWCDLVSKMSHHMKWGSVGSGLGTRGLRIEAALMHAVDALP